MRGSPSSHLVSLPGRPPPAQRATTGTARYYLQRRSRNDDTTKIQVVILTSTPIINASLRHRRHPTIIWGDVRNEGTQQMLRRGVFKHILQNDHWGVVNDFNRQQRQYTSMPIPQPFLHSAKQQSGHSDKRVGTTHWGRGRHCHYHKFCEGNYPIRGKQ